MEFLLGRLTLEALPHEWFTIGGTIFVTLLAVGVLGFITYFKKWTWLWKEWLTSVDPKKIGIMYIVVAVLMFVRGALDAVMIWLQQSMAVGASHGYLSADHFQQIFTAHGVIMVFFVTMGLLFGLLNIVVPLQIGTRDLASPFLNTLGFWLYVFGAILLNMFFVLGGEFSATGWLAVSPLSELQFSPGVGVDYWIWSLQVSGLGTTLGGINFLVTILKMRAPGMTLLRMPLFVWTSLCSSVLIITIFPILTVTTALLSLDRLFGMHFFTTDAGGNAMMYINLIWMWGHPEVYVLILPAFGIYSEVVATFSQKRLAGYISLVCGAIGVTVLSIWVWLHHFFTMGAGANVNAFFGIMTMFIAVPTSVQIFSWLATMYKGRIRFYTPMLWFLGFLSTFTFGGMTGMLLALPPADFQLHNSLFLVAHFHTMAVGGAVFGIIAGLIYWFPKISGFTLNEKLGKIAFWLWLIGFYTSFVPLYILGLMGATRRLDHYTNPSWQALFITSTLGAFIICVAVSVQVFQVLVSYKNRKKNRDETGDPWNGRTLEWATSSPAPFYNFAQVPHVHSIDAFWEAKENGELKKPEYEDIQLPKNTALGIYLAGFIFLIGFAFIWHLFWLVGVGVIGALICFIKRTFDDDTEYVLKAHEVEALEKGRKYYA